MTAPKNVTQLFFLDAAIPDLDGPHPLGCEDNKLCFLFIGSQFVVGHVGQYLLSYLLHLQTHILRGVCRHRLNVQMTQNYFLNHFPIIFQSFFNHLIPFSTVCAICDTACGPLHTVCDLHGMSK
jgi:hypothetical protein